MGGIKYLRKCFDHVIACIRCELYGHSDVVKLDSYEPLYREKKFRQVGRKIFRDTLIETDKIFIEKCACRACGTVFLYRRIERQ